jgi:hypothetical protein
MLAGVLLENGGKGILPEKQQQLIPFPSEWTVVRAQYGGQVVQEAHVSFSYTRVTRNRLWVFARIGDEIVVHHAWAEYVQNTSVEPARFDFRDRKGICSFDGQFLLICSAEEGMPRPTGFRTTPGDHRLLLILKLKDEKVYP